jgi:hypothetical protein
MAKKNPTLPKNSQRNCGSEKTANAPSGEGLESVADVLMGVSSCWGGGSIAQPRVNRHRVAFVQGCGHRTGYRQQRFHAMFDHHQVRGRLTLTGCSGQHYDDPASDKLDPEFSNHQGV